MSRKAWHWHQRNYQAKHLMSGYIERHSQKSQKQEKQKDQISTTQKGCS